MKKAFLTIVLASLFLTGCVTSNPPQQQNPTDNNNLDVIITNPTPPNLEITHSFASASDGVFVNFYWDGEKYLYFGSVDKPTPCHKISIDLTVAESFPEQVAMNVIINLPSEENCITVIENQTFEGELLVDEQAQLTVEFNGNELVKN